ncbi:MAG: lysine--tRNA ligase [Clostridia bacterium]
MEKSEQILENNEDLSELLQVRRDKLKNLQDAGKNPFEITKFDVTNHTTDITSDFEAFEGKEVTVAGRLMAKRMMGKAGFINILDRYGNIQSYVRKDHLEEESFEDFKKYDIGDLIGVTGVVFMTQKGEISIKASSVTLLSKSLLPLPEKFHGLKDPDLRYRQRYVDLIVNPEVRRTFELRTKIIREIRRYLDDLDFMEVETPVLNTIPGGAAARPFITHHNTLDIDMYLRIATELHLKRLIVGGFERVYEIGRIFRNEGMSIKHNPEFTSIELYQAYTDFEGMMDITEGIISTCAKKVLGVTTVNYQGEDINLGDAFTRISMVDAVKQYSGVDFNSFTTAEDATAACKAAGVHVDGVLSWGNALNLMFEEKVEENLVQPTFITEYPVEVSPLAKRMASDHRLTERFELFITRRELANAFSELNDPIDQKERFLEQVAMLEAGNDEANMMDDDFVTALEYGMPPTGGLGIGIDRLVMLLTDSFSIRDVLLFPTMKPNN